MATEVEICNMALDLIGANRITSLADNTLQGRICAANYPLLRDAVLTAYPWRFAIRRVSLTALVSTPIYGWGKEYQLPTGPNPLKWLLVLDTAQDATTADKEWTIEGTKLVADYSSPLLIRYIGQVTNTQEFDSLFVIALSARLAVHLSANITESAGRIDQARSLYQETIAEARATNGTLGKSGILRSIDLLSSRGEGFPIG